MKRQPLKTWAACTPENPFVVVTDTICTGWQCFKAEGFAREDDNAPPLLYTTARAISADVNDDFLNADGELWAMPLSEFLAAGGNGRKAIFHGAK